MLTTMQVLKELNKKLQQYPDLSNRNLSDPKAFFAKQIGTDWGELTDYLADLYTIIQHQRDVVEWVLKYAWVVEVKLNYFMNRTRRIQFPEDTLLAELKQHAPEIDWEEELKG